MGLDTRAWMLKEHLRNKCITLPLHELQYPSHPRVLLLRSHLPRGMTYTNEWRLTEEVTSSTFISSDHNTLPYLGY